VTTPAAPLPIDVSVASVARGARWRRWWRRGWPPLLAALGCAGAYAAFARGPHDGGGAGAAFRFAATATFLAGPTVTLGVLAWAVVRTRDGIAAGDLRRTAPALVAAAVSIGTVAWLFSPLGRALTAWYLG
jgi:hypothetical protein